MCSDIRDRYNNIAKIARSHSILSVGLSVFRFKTNPKDEDDPNLWKFHAENFDITTFCNDEYILEEEAQNFLSSYGFDFEHQRAHGLQYSKGNQVHESPSLTNFLNHIKF